MHGLGGMDEARAMYEQALGISREIGHRRGEGSDLGNLGIAWASLGEVRKAIEHYEHHMVPFYIGALGSRSNQAKRKEMYRDMAMIVHNEGGVMVPMFNNFIDATGPKIGGWIGNPNGELMSGSASSECTTTSGDSTASCWGPSPGSRPLALSGTRMLLSN